MKRIKIIGLITLTVAWLMGLAGASWATIVEWTPDANTVLLFHLNEGSGTTTVDVGPVDGANTGTLGASYPAWTTGKFGAGLAAIAGDTEYLATTIAATGIFTDQMTFDAWIKPSGVDTAGASYIGGANGSGYFYLRINASGALGFGVYTVSTDWQEQSSPVVSLLDGQWHHVAGVADADPLGGTLSIYLDGVLVSSATHTGLTTLNDIGSNVSIAGGPFYAPESTGLNYIGLVDEVRLSNVARDFTGAFVPEPSSVLLFGVGAGILGLRRRRKNME